MPKRYTQDFKDMLIELHNAGKGPAELSKDYDGPVATLGKWFTDASQEENRQVSSAEVAQLKADLLLATQENEILKKALGIFAQKR